MCNINAFHIMLCSTVGFWDQLRHWQQMCRWPESGFQLHRVIIQQTGKLYHSPRKRQGLLYFTQRQGSNTQEAVLLTKIIKKHETKEASIHLHKVNQQHISSPVGKWASRWREHQKIANSHISLLYTPLH